MLGNRTAYFASTLLTSFACLALGACSFSAQAGSSGSKSPSHEHREKRPKRSHDEKREKKKHDDADKKKPTESKKDTEPKDTPKKTEPDETPKDAPLAPGMSRIVVPVNTSLKALQAKLEEELPNNEAQKTWKRVGKKNKNREVDIRYEIWRDPIKLSVNDHTLRVVVPVQYASDFRAKVDKPVGKGKIWLTHGETWGTKERKQTMKVTLDFNLKVNENYELESHSKLVSINHGAPPEGKACTDTAVEICVPKKDLASYVEDELDEKNRQKDRKDPEERRQEDRQSHRAEAAGRRDLVGDVHARGIAEGQSGELSYACRQDLLEVCVALVYTEFPRPFSESDSRETTSAFAFHSTESCKSPRTNPKTRPRSCRS
ncbi:MAG: DUF4403 family protein [Polyangiaceae bacterium]